MACVHRTAVDNRFLCLSIYRCYALDEFRCVLDLVVYSIY